MTDPDTASRYHFRGSVGPGRRDGWMVGMLGSTRRLAPRCGNCLLIAAAFGHRLDG
ncbi:MAG: hypothetical protein OEO18_18680 [Gammaproteobacteria bacterium]|nr:hypothetical protein [Gammaproteobacteria bacterium]